MENVLDHKVTFRMEFVPDCEWERRMFAAIEFRVHNPDVRAVQMPPKYRTIADQAPDHRADTSARCGRWLERVGRGPRPSRSRGAGRSRSNVAKDVLCHP